MKKQTANFIVIMFSGVLLMTLLTGSIFRQRQGRPLLPRYVFTQESLPQQVPPPDELVSPDRIDGNDLKRRITSHEEAVGDGSGKADKSGVTTAVATTVTASATSKTTASAVTEEAEETGSYITGQDYKSPYYIVVYTGSQSVGVYGKGESGEYTRLVRTFTCSTGRTDVSPTRKGMYRIRAKYRWRLLVGNVYGQYNSSISSSYLFHSVPYYRQNASTLENEEYDKQGTPASKGCIRMCVRDCKWIYDNCPIGTQVHIVWASGPAGPGVPQRVKEEAYSGWDPSDRWADGNPYFAPDASVPSSTTEADPTTASSAPATTVTQAQTTAASQNPSSETEDAA